MGTMMINEPWEDDDRPWGLHLADIMVFGFENEGIGLPYYHKDIGIYWEIITTHWI